MNIYKIFITVSISLGIALLVKAMSPVDRDDIGQIGDMARSKLIQARQNNNIIYSLINSTKH